MEVRILDRREDSLRILIRGIDVSVANSLRRIMMTEVPTMAIEDVIIIENTSPIKDEALSLRLGLIPLRTDLDSYIMQEDCDCDSELGCSKCSVALTLESYARDLPQTVYSKVLESIDPNIVPASGETPILKLAEGQRVRLEAYAKLGLGLEHAKWQPTCRCTYKYVGKINVNSDQCDLCEKCVKACFRGVLAIDDGVRILQADECNLCEECVKTCPRDAISVERVKDTYIFNIESTGSLPSERIFLEAVRILKKKNIEFTASIKALEEIRE